VHIPGNYIPKLSPIIDQLMQGNEERKIEIKKDWPVIMSAFQTVEEAIVDYPELKPHFERMFDKKF